MEKEIKKEPKVFDNSSYRERFQFILQINENIICQRFFKINGFTYESLESEEFKNVMDEVVGMIQNDLISKSRIYEWYTTPTPIKLTGFVNNIDEYKEHEKRLILDNSVTDSVVECEGHDNVVKTFFDYNDEVKDLYDEERPADGEFVFKFIFLVDDKECYVREWDGNVYPKYVRNGVDLTNSDVAYRDKDPMSLHFNLAIIRHLTNDKVDLTYHIIKRICSVLSQSYVDEYGEYTKKVQYANNYDGVKNEGKTYYYTTYNREYVNGWRTAVEQKTREYFGTMYPSDRQIEVINKYL